MSRQATKETAVNERLSTLRLIGGNDILPDRLAKYPDLDVDGGARIRKSMAVAGDTILQGETTIEGNLVILGNTTISSLDISDDLLLQGNLMVSGNTDVSTLNVNEDLSVVGDTDVCGNLLVKGESIFQGNTQINSITGDMNIDGNVNLGGSVSINGTQVVTAQQPNVGNVIIGNISGTGDDININSNFANIEATLNNALAILKSHGLMA